MTTQAMKNFGSSSLHSINSILLAGEKNIGLQCEGLGVIKFVRVVAASTGVRV